MPTPQSLHPFLYLPLGSEAMIWGHGGTAKNQPRDLVVWWGGITSHSKNL